MKNLKYISGLILLVVILIPQVTFASWWNPFSWFKKPAPVITQQVAPLQPVEQPTVMQPVAPKITTPKKTTAPKTTSPKLITASDFLKSQPTYVPVDRILTDYRTKTQTSFQDQISALDTEQKIEEILVMAVQSNISDINDKITGGNGFKIGNPDSASTVDYLNGIFTAQVKYLQSEIDSRNRMIDWLKTAYSNATTELIQLQASTTTAQIDAHVKNIQAIKDSLANVKTVSDTWSNDSHKMQVQIDGTIAGLKSANAPSTNTNSLPSIIINNPPAFTPAKYCLTEPTVIGTETHCY